MKTQLLVLFFIATTLGYSQELVVDLSIPDQITITAGSGNSLATVSGSDNTGFYLAGIFTGGPNPIAASLVSGNLTSALEASDLTPLLFRQGDSDPGLNVWSYTDASTSNFAAGSIAFSGSATWDIPTAVYNELLSAPAAGDIYFPADDIGDLQGAVLIGRYSVTQPLGVNDLVSNKFDYHPNPVTNVLNFSSEKVIEQIDVYTMLGQSVGVHVLKTLEGSINTASLASGTYFFKATFQDNSVRTFKINKN